MADDVSLLLLLLFDSYFISLPLFIIYPLLLWLLFNIVIIINLIITVNIVTNPFDIYFYPVFLKNRNENTPLHHASLHGHKELVKVLLKAWADPNQENNVRLLFILVLILSVIAVFVVTVVHYFAGIEYCFLLNELREFINKIILLYWLVIFCYYYDVVVDVVVLK